MDKRVLAVLAVVFFVAVATNLQYSESRGFGEKITSAIDGVTHYRISTEVSARTTGSAGANQVDLRQELKAVGVTDVTGQKMMVNAEIENAVGNTSSVTMYLIDDVMYVKNDGQWTIQSVPAEYGVWDKRYQLRQLGRIIADSELKVIGRGKDSILIELSPGRETLAQYINEQMTPPGYPQSDSTAIADALKDVRINVSVDSETMLPTEFRMSTSVEQGGLSRETEIVVKLWDYNKPLHVALPQEVEEYKQNIAAQQLS